MRLVGRSFAVLIALFLAACAQQGPAAETKPRTDARPDYAYWPHEVSDIKVDPAVRFGVLPNGMHYALMRNAQPAGTISLRLRIASGSLQENDQQLGLAHFMEHMAFNGSKNVPEGDFVKLLQRKGLAFGAHTNAYTSTDETVYMLELPKNDADLVDTGLMLFREIGDRLTLDPAAIEREKGVVLSELRTRNTPEYRAYVTRWKQVYDGQRQAQRMPIGTVETIKGATRDLLADYYRQFYRPERSLFVATGDFDPAELEAKLKAKFGDWKADGTDPKDPEQGALKQRGLVAASHVEANLPENASVTWFQPPDDSDDTQAMRARNLPRRLAISIISRRLARIARAENAPFVGAGVAQSNERGISQTMGLAVSTRPGQWQRGLSAAEQELRRAVQYGFSEAEVARELKEWRAALEDAVAKQGTRDTKGLADQLVGSFSGRTVFSPPADQLARFERLAPSVTPDSVLVALREMSGGQGPLVFVSSSQVVAGGDAAIAAAFEASVKTAVSAPAKDDAKTFPYADFGKPGTVAEKRDVADLGVTTVRFANGVMLNVKQTDFERDSAHVSVRFAGGTSELPADKVGLSIVLPFAFTEGGLKKLTTDELEAALAGRLVSADLGMDEEATELAGKTNKRDMLLQMQLLAAFATDPAYRSGGLERIQAAAENFIKQYSSSPGRVADREAASLLRSGDKRWAFPTLAQVKALKIGDVEAALKPLLAHSPVEITVVGDVAPADVIAAVGATFGALPARAAKLEPRGSRDIRFPTGLRPVRFTHEGRADQAMGYVAWSGPDFYSNPRRARAMSILREVLEVRLIEEFREAQGATYSPSVGSWNSGAFANYGFLRASAETRPELVETFFKTVDKIVAEFRAGEISDDVFDRARRPMIDNAEADRRSNDFWEGALEDIQSQPLSLDTIRTQISDLKGITKAEVVAVAKQYLGPQRVEVRVFPAKTASSSK